MGRFSQGWTMRCHCGWVVQIKRLIILLAIVVLYSCEQKQQEKQKTAPEDKVVTVSQKNESDTVSKSKSWLNPDFLSADFNGDGFFDTAFAVTVNGKRGIRIRHGNTNDEFLIGAGSKFGNGGDDFDWVENWNLVTDKTTYEVTFMENGDIDGGREVKLDHTAFYIGADEVGGATVAWRGGKYVWIHQAD